MPTLEQHLHTPHIGIEEHIAARRTTLSHSLQGKTAIYLDVRFWVMVREVRDGSSINSAEREIVDHLEALVNQGLAFCPIAEPTFSELMKQGDLGQRVATARAVDDLSCGASLLPDPLRMADETENVVLALLKG
jgi:hypothetical protein